MEDGQKVIAKIPHPNAGPPVLTTASEVATMEFARDILSLPVPKVLAWSATDQNPVEAEYIIMEEARGSRLNDIWQDLQLPEQRDIILELVKIETKFLSVCFEKIGSLYYADSGISKCEPAIATGPQEMADALKSRFCIGPTVQPEFWEKERRHMHQYQGPWTSAVEYLESIVKREIEWIGSYADPRQARVDPGQFTSPQQNSPHAHIETLKKFLPAIPLIVPKDPDVVSPRFWRPDLHRGNIYVDDQRRISCIIDWQSATIAPLIFAANPPPLLDYTVEKMYYLPPHYESLKEGEEKQKLRHQVSQTILIDVYERTTAAENPLMIKMMTTYQGRTLKQLHAFVGGTWDNCLYPLQGCMIIARREWEDFDTDEPCPYSFSDEEIQKIYDDADAFNENRDFWRDVSHILSDNGYTPNDTYDEAMDIFKNKLPKVAKRDDSSPSSTS
ncbi:uncharacterized protein EI97DRAFT_438940 [Westerdykella ornata]|uniref:Altered inheritance of mitochondria protein 9, mitochondrial n=1 Tax=Westerdykella ornata TaxID=318751 RepID=A0A6A6JYC0_WESOR|nr:uncharacterized protein EI97DRAFT_438940 [Westerdykella ornata]KAF2281620.1 hypothetical protein EI97DRAFT_438940 [Westerdykella ornata]